MDTSDQSALAQKLTGRHRDCLRLVWNGHSTKEIAIALGISPGTVDQYIKAAVRILGASTRRQAAKLLAEVESHAAPLQKLEVPLGTVAPTDLPAQPDDSGREGNLPPSSSPNKPEVEAWTEIDPGDAVPSANQARFPIPTKQRPQDDFGTRERILWIFVIAVSASFLLLGLLAGTKVTIEYLGKLT